MRIKKLIALGLATAMAVSAFVGCGKDKAEKKVKVIEIDLTSEEYAFGVDKNQPELLEDVNKRGTTMLVATHAKEFVDNMQKRVLAVEHGVLVRDEEEGAYGYDV